MKTQVYQIDSNGFIIDVLEIKQGEILYEEVTFTDPDTGEEITQTQPRQDIVYEKIAQGLKTPKWDSTNQEWVEGITPEIELQKAKDEKIEEIYNACDNALLYGFASSLIGSDNKNIEFYYDEKGQMKLNSQVNKINLLLNRLNKGEITQTDFDNYFPINWNTKSHGWVRLSYNDFIQLIDDAENHEVTNFQKRAGLEQQIEAAATVDEVNAISW